MRSVEQFAGAGGLALGTCWAGFAPELFVEWNGDCAATLKMNQQLRARLREHAATIRAASSTLDIDDFWVRFRTVDNAWIGHAEGLLIRRFSPI